jgi:hypothetical protein
MPVSFNRHGETLGLELSPGTALAVELDKCRCCDFALLQQIKAMEKKALSVCGGGKAGPIPEHSFTDSPWLFVSEATGVSPAPLTV